MRGRALFVGVVLLVAAGDASAQGWMAGAQVGQSKTYDYSVGGPIDDLDDSDTSWRVFLGYEFTRFFGGAVSYVDLGEMTAAGPAFGGFTDVLEATGWEVSALGMLPVNERWGFYGNVGAFRWEQDVHYVDPTGVYDYDDSGTSPTVGVGVNFDVLPKTLGVHVGYHRFFDVGDEDNSGHEYDRSMIAAGLSWSFGAP